MSTKLAILDIIDGAKNYEFWMTFGMNDVKAKYRRSKIGQWWITLSVAIFIFVIGGLYRGIFNTDASGYMAYLAVGYITWLFISDSLSSGCNILVQAKPFLLQRNWPVSTFIFRLMYREILFIAHHAILLPPIFIWLKLWPGIDGLFFAFLGFLMCVFAAFWAALLLSILTLRYRDISPIVQSLLRMAFFATPIIWIERDLGAFGEIVVMLNPFGYFLHIVRDPLLGVELNPTDWAICFALCSGIALLSLSALAVTKKRLIYWL